MNSSSTPLYDMNKALFIAAVLFCLLGAYNIYAAVFYLTTTDGFISGAGNTLENKELLVKGLVITVMGITALLVGNWLGKKRILVRLKSDVQPLNRHTGVQQS